MLARRVIGFLLWCVLRAFVWVAMRSHFTFNDPVTGDPYLTRWPLWTREPWPDALGRTGGEGWYLHCFHRSDWSRNLHNHPFDSGEALILREGYHEARREGPAGALEKRAFPPLSRNRLGPTTYHRTELLREGRPSWSLFWIGPRSGRGWGFLREDGGTDRAAHYDGHTGEVVKR